MNNGAPRVYWIEALKFAGIVLVVLGHTSGLNVNVRSYIYSFHMPLFFFISGFLLKRSNLEKRFVENVKKYFSTLIIPYLVFGLVTYVAWFFLQRHFGFRAELNVNPYKPLFGLFYGVGAGTWLAQDTPLWFFAALFVT
ncbi:MAG: acyltransferase family protein, partial [Pyrinomonadaceae bacterium]